MNHPLGALLFCFFTYNGMITEVTGADGKKAKNQNNRFRGSQDLYVWRQLYVNTCRWMAGK